MEAEGGRGSSLLPSSSLRPPNTRSAGVCPTCPDLGMRTQEDSELGPVLLLSLPNVQVSNRELTGLCSWDTGDLG